jgi:glyoxylase-like metal-dependent hydrolase (beta-lactamase superfamily II)
MEVAAEGVWVMRGGWPHRTMNVYFLEGRDGVTVFDAGIRSMTPHVVAVGQKMGGLKRIVLGHAHVDHRGAAPGAGVPVWCHADDAADAEGDGGLHYANFELLPRFTKAGPVRAAFPTLMKRVWDGGPVRVAKTLAEGDSVNEFDVVHFPGHAPGLIGLWRERDRLMLASDVFYTLDPTTGEFGQPRVPHTAFNEDTEQARASIRKLATMEPRLAWAGHADPLRGDVRGQLEHAAATT